MRNLYTPLFLLALLGPLTTSARAEISITSPSAGATVCALQRVSGTLSPPPRAGDDKVWIVINPMLTPSDYWVQDPLTAQGNWAGFVHFGETGRHFGLPFQFRAFFGPELHLTVGKTGGWPANAAMASGVVEVKRGSCDHSS